MSTESLRSCLPVIAPDMYGFYSSYFLIPTRISSTSFNFGEHFVFEICAVPTGAIEVGFVISEWYLIAYE